MSPTGHPWALPNPARTISMGVGHFFEVEKSTCLRLSILNRFLIDFGWILRPKIDQKSIKKSITFLIDFLIDV